jgi:hypothetical protein
MTTRIFGPNMKRSKHILCCDFLEVFISEFSISQLIPSNRKRPPSQAFFFFLVHKQNNDDNKSNHMLTANTFNSPIHCIGSRPLLRVIFQVVCLHMGWYRPIKRVTQQYYTKSVASRTHVFIVLKTLILKLIKAQIH